VNKKRSAVITGGAGFIGSHLVDALLSRKFDVVVVDNFSTGRRENLTNAQEKIRIKSSGIEEGLRDLPFVPDVVFHNGLPSTTELYRQNRLELSNAVHDAVMLYEYCSKHKIPLVLASTCSLYNGLPTPHKEDAHVLVKDFYTEARLTMERVAEVYSELYGLRGIALRYFSVYGPRDEGKGNSANVITQFYSLMKRGEKPEIYGDGTQSRDFIFISDVVEANMRAMEFLEASERRFEVFNVGTGRSTTFNDLISILGRRCEMHVEPMYKDNPIKNYVYGLQADTSKAEKLLGFKAKTRLEKGIELMGNYLDVA